MAYLTTIGFDADDTLWDHEKYFVATKDRYVALMAGHADAEAIAKTLHDTEIANLGLYGYGVKSFTLSMIETAVAATNGCVPGNVIGDILALGRDMLTHPVDPYPGVRDTLEALSGRYKLLVVTRGDLIDQERKLSASGLLPLFDEIEIVSDKTTPIYQRIFTRHGDGPERAMMIGNSMRADVVPALAAGAWGIHIPSDYVWSVDLDEAPAGASRFRQLSRIGEVLPVIAEVG